jgi:hypothetical protein
MEPRPVPNCVAEHGDVTVIDVGPPPGVDADDCGTANMAVFTGEFSGKETPIYIGYFQPTKEELEYLNNGAYIGLQMVSVVVPHSMHVQPL